MRATIHVGDGPNGIAVTPGAVWVSNEFSGTLSRIDPDRDVVVQTVTTGNRPQGLVREAGALFVAVRTSGAGHRGGRLTLLTSSGDLRGGRFLDPALAYTQTEWQVVALTNDGLTGFRRVGGTAGTRLVPDLAVSLPIPTDGGRSYTFRLRPGSATRPVRSSGPRTSGARSSEGCSQMARDGGSPASSAPPPASRRPSGATSRGGS